MFKPWVSIPVNNVVVAVDHDYGDVRIMFKDTATIDETVKQLENLRGVVKEMEDNKEVLT